MKITKKLRDVTPKEYIKLVETSYRDCDDCPFTNSVCNQFSKKCWVYHKDTYSDKFLDQTIEIEIPDILTKEEKEYLSYVIKPFRDKVTNIKKVFLITPKRKYIKIEYREDKIDAISVSLCFPDLPNDKMYKGMKENKPYTLEELGL